MSSKPPHLFPDLSGNLLRAVRRENSFPFHGKVVYIGVTGCAHKSARASQKQSTRPAGQPADNHTMTTSTPDTPRSRVGLYTEPRRSHRKRKKSSFGTHLFRLRMARGMTQAELAKKAGLFVTRPDKNGNRGSNTIVCLETGRHGWPSLTTLVKLARALWVMPSVLIGAEEKGDARGLPIPGECVQVFARNLRAAREATGWEPALLAQESGLCAQTVKNLESGNYEPRLGSILALAKALGMSIDTLIVVGGVVEHGGK